MRTYIDVDTDDWFYNEIIEASNFVLSDGLPLISGYKYSEFETGQSYYYNEFTCAKGQKSFSINKTITPTKSNPLYVYINGAQAIYSKLDTTSYSNTTIVWLASAPSEGSTVSFFSAGIPKIDSFNRPAESNTPYLFKHPSAQIQKSLPNQYTYNPLGRNFQEYLISHGRKLKRISVDQYYWDRFKNMEHRVAEKYIGDLQDVYICSPTGLVFVPYNLNNVTCTFEYAAEKDNVVLKMTETLKPYSQYTYRNDRFFPKANISRAEAFTLINRLRRHLYRQFTDKLPPTGEVLNIYNSVEGQRVYKTDSQFVVGGELLVFVNGVRKYLGIDYIEFNNHTIVFNNPPVSNVQIWIGYSKYPIKSFELDEIIIVQDDNQSVIHLNKALPFKDGKFNTNFIPTIKLNSSITLNYKENFEITESKVIDIFNVPLKQGDVIKVTADYNYDQSFEETIVATQLTPLIFTTSKPFPYRDVDNRDIGGQVKVYLNETLQKFKIDYDEIANNKIQFFNPVIAGSVVKIVLDAKVSRFYDIGGWATFKINGTQDTETDDGQYSYWVDHVLELEYEQFKDSQGNDVNFVEGKLVGTFEPVTGYPIVNSAFEVISFPKDSPTKRYFLARGNMTRSEIVALFNRFRKWAIDRFR